MGASDYDDPAIHSLPFIWDDLRRLAAALKGRGFHSVDIGESRRGITPNFVDSQVSNFLWTAKRGETLLIMLSGHGLHFDGADYLIPEDAHLSSSSIERSCIKIDWARELEKSPAAQVVFLIDACREGVDRDSMASPVGIRQWSNRKIEDSLRRKVAYVYACSTSQFALFVRKTDSANKDLTLGIESGESFSLFSRAVSDVVASLPLSDLESFENSIQQRIDELHHGYGKARAPQRLHVVTDRRKQDFMVLPQGLTLEPTVLSGHAPQLPSSQSSTARSSPAETSMSYASGQLTTARKITKKRLIQANNIAMQFYSEQLLSPEGVTARDILKRHGFDRRVQFHNVGYSPRGGSHLITLLRAKGFSEEEMRASGLVAERSGGASDRFQGRLMWPICDIAGSSIGFDAHRLYEDDKGPISIITPETLIFKKDQAFYGIDSSKKNISRSGHVLVVENHFDVIACRTSGVGDAVSTCGTSVLGRQHIDTLKALAPERPIQITFAVSDSGVATKIARILFEQLGDTARIMMYPSTYSSLWHVRSQSGSTAVRELRSFGEPLSHIVIRDIANRHPVQTSGGKSKALDEAVQFITQLMDPTARQAALALAVELDILDSKTAVEYLSDISDQPSKDPDSSSSKSTLAAAPSARIPAEELRSSTPSRSRLDLRSPVHRVERELLKLALQHPHLVSPAFDAYSEDEFTAPPYAAVRQAIASAGGTENADDAYLTRVCNFAPHDSIRILITELATEALHSRRPPDEQYAGMQLAAVRIQAVERRIREVRSDLTQLGPLAEAEVLATVQKKLWALQQYSQRLRELGPSAL